MTPKAWSWCVASLILATSPTAEAATVLERRVTIDIQGDGAVKESVLLKVRVETEDDLERWATYPIYLDENRSLEQLSAQAVRADGTRVKLGRKHQDTLELSGAGILHQSGHLQTVDFPGIAVGWTLQISYQVLTRPYYPAGQLGLIQDDPVRFLKIEVHGGGNAWRWRLDGPASGLEIEETASGVRLIGRELPAWDLPELAPRGAAVHPVLRYGWGDDASWAGLGRWYGGILKTVPRGAEPVRRRARELIAGIHQPRQRLEVLLSFLRQKVRYVAVEIGIGGFQPTPPEEVLERKWGDCKDKALLLIDFLSEAGIEAYPALILADRDRRIDLEFPSPQFNHLIVAVPADAVELAEDEPVSEGFLFVDPTQTRGSARWLQPADQDQDVVVVHPGGATVVRTAIRQQLELRSAHIEVEVSPEGDATGEVRLRLSGLAATPWLEQMATTRPERTAEDLVKVFGRLLPGVTVQKVGWRIGPGGVPNVEMKGDVIFDGMIRGTAERRSFQLPGLRAAPEPRLTSEREAPIVVRPRSSETTWSIRLPTDWCLPEAKEQTVETAVGVFRQSLVHQADGVVVVRRGTELRQRWIEPEAFPELEKLALAEHRAHRRRIRLKCRDGDGVSSPTSSR